MQASDTRGTYGYHPYYAQAPAKDPTRYVSRYIVRRDPSNKPPPPSVAPEKLKKRSDFSKGGEYLALGASSSSKAADCAGEPQRLQLDPADLADHGGGPELGERVFGWMGNPRYDESVYNMLEKKNKKKMKD